MTPTPTACPGCQAPMRAIELARAPHGQAVVDLCDTCHALWFDAFESVQLTPGGTLALFREVHGAAVPARRPLPQRMPCPRCKLALLDTHDLQRATRFRYWRCPRGHGRFTPFVQFLREKDFIRPLSAAEIERLRSHIRTIRCSGCGAPVDLARDMVCRYCSAPIEALDPSAIETTVQRLENAEHKRGEIDVDKLADALLMRYSRKGADDAYALTIESAGFDLIGTGIDVVLSAIDAA